jgi:hypothetical protein
MSDRNLYQRLKESGFELNVKLYGALGDGTTDDTASIQAAVDDAYNKITTSPYAGGAIVFFPAGLYKVSTPITFKTSGVLNNRNTNVTLQGAGRGATIIQKAQDTIILDISGADTTHWVIGVQVRDMTLRGGSVSSWNSSLVRSYYSQFIHFDNVNFLDNFGCAIDMVQCYDSYITQCRFDQCGDNTNSLYAIWLKKSNQGVSSGFGHGADNTNNIWITNTVLEQCRFGAIYCDGREFDGSVGSASINQISLVNVKIENQVGTWGSPFIKLYRTSASNFGPIYMGIKNSTGAALDLISIDGASYGCSIHDVWCNINETVSPFVRSLISVGSNNSYISIDNIALTAQTVNKPTVALLTYDGTSNTNFKVENIRYVNNPGAAILQSGAATTAIPFSVAAGPGGPQIYTGSGAPAVSAVVGSLYIRTDGGAATSLYVKESGTGSAGWVAK